MPVTSNNALPYPGPTDAPDGPTQLQSLAETLDDVITSAQSATSDLTAKTAPGLATTFPVGPDDGQLAYLSVPSAGDYAVVWTFRYNDSLGVWQFLAGPPLMVKDDGSGTRNSTSYGDLTAANAGPSITLPNSISGDFIVSIECRIQTGSSGNSATAAWRVNNGTEVDAGSIPCDGTNATVGTRTYSGPNATLAGGDVVGMRYKCSAAGASTFGRRMISLLPINADPI